MSAAALNMFSRQGPYCECGECDATGRNGGEEVRLPASAWSVAGYGDIDAIAVLAGHETPFDNEKFVMTDHYTWVEVREVRRG